MQNGAARLRPFIDALDSSTTDYCLCTHENDEAQEPWRLCYMVDWKKHVLRLGLAWCCDQTTVAASAQADCLPLIVPLVTAAALPVGMYLGATRGAWLPENTCFAHLR